MKKRHIAVLAAVLLTGLLTVSAFAAGPGPCGLDHIHTAACTGGVHFSQHCMRDGHHKYDCAAPAFRPAAAGNWAPAALTQAAPEAPAPVQPVPAAQSAPESAPVQPVPGYNCPYGGNCPYSGSYPYGGNCPYGADCPYGGSCPYDNCIYVEAPRQGGGCHSSHHGGHH